MTTYTPEQLLPIVRVIHKDAWAGSENILVPTTKAEYRIVDHRDWNFLMPLAIKLKISIEWYTDRERCHISNLEHTFDRICTTEEEIKGAVIECGLAVIGGRDG